MRFIPFPRFLVQVKAGRNGTLEFGLSAMHINIQLLPVSLGSDAISSTSVVVIDVLRATSVIVHAISQGAPEILPVNTVEEAFQAVKHFPEGTALLGGERGSRKIGGFDLGNSPREYIAEKVKGRSIILTTTNGTKAFHCVSSGRKVMAGSFFNIGAIARQCLDLGNDLLIYPSGDEGNFSLEDTVCGGMLIDRILMEAQRDVFLTDASRSALILYQRFKENLIEAFHLSTHGRELIERGFGEDLAYCIQTDITGMVPTFRDGVIRAQ